MDNRLRVGRGLDELLLCSLRQRPGDRSGTMLSPRYLGVKRSRVQIPSSSTDRGKSALLGGSFVKAGTSCPLLAIEHWQEGSPTLSGSPAARATPSQLLNSKAGPRKRCSAVNEPPNSRLRPPITRHAYSMHEEIATGRIECAYQLWRYSFNCER
jgi:hypothetical protein